MAYDRSPSKNIYLNVAVNTLKKLRGLVPSSAPGLTSRSGRAGRLGACVCKGQACACSAGPRAGVWDAGWLSAARSTRHRPWRGRGRSRWRVQLWAAGFWGGGRGRGPAPPRLLAVDSPLQRAALG